MTINYPIACSSVRRIRGLFCAGLGAVLASGIACGSPPPPPQQELQQEALHASPDAAPQPWSASSARIEIHSFGFWEGGWRFEADRAALSAEQRRLLEGFRKVAPSTSCPQDIPEQAITIYDAAGGSREYRVNPLDASCRRTAEFLAWASVKPFLETLACLSAGATRGRSHTAANAPTIVPDDGCSHGLFGELGGNTIWLRLKVTEASRLHRIEALRCDASDVVLAVYDARATTELARGGAGTGAACASIAHAFPRAGDYMVRIDKKASARAGDFFLRVTTP